MALSLNLHHNLPLEQCAEQGKAGQGTASSGLWVQHCLLLLLKEPLAINMCRGGGSEGGGVREGEWE